MKISVPNFVTASGPTFSSTVTVPVANLPIYLYDYILQCSNGCNVDPISTIVSMKPSSMTTRVLELQGRLRITSVQDQYTLTYTFNGNDDMYQRYASSIQYAPFPSGEFSIENDPSIYNASDYWTYRVVDVQVIMTFQPSIDMASRLQGHHVYYDITV